VWTAKISARSPPSAGRVIDDTRTVPVSLTGSFQVNPRLNSICAVTPESITAVHGSVPGLTTTPALATTPQRT